MLLRAIASFFFFRVRAQTATAVVGTEGFADISLNVPPSSETNEPRKAKLLDTVAESTSDSVASPCAKHQTQIDKWAESGLKVDSQDSKLSQMAAVAGSIYFLGSLDGWAVAKHWILGDTKNCYLTSAVGIYRRVTSDGPLCVLAFSGTDNVQDWQDNLNAASAGFCGFEKVHAGFAARAREFMDGSMAKETQEYLDKNCDGAATVVGHSLGGAIAALTAACAVTRKTFDVKGLYTFGAPSVSKTQLGNDGKCFEGARVYNYGDGVPGVAQALGFGHPQMQSIMVDECPDGNFSTKVYGCDTDESKNSPSFISNFMPRGATERARVHTIREYIRRLVALPEDEPAQHTDLKCSADGLGMPGKLHKGTTPLRKMSTTSKALRAALIPKH